MPYYQQPDLQGQGFYNPNMKGPDFGQGVREIIGGLIEKKRYAQEQELTRNKLAQDQLKEQIKLAQEEKKIASLDRYRKFLEGKENKPVAIQIAEKIQEENPGMSFGRAVLNSKGILSDNEWKEREKYKASLKTTGEKGNYETSLISIKRYYARKANDFTKQFSLEKAKDIFAKKDPSTAQGYTDAMAEALRELQKSEIEEINELNRIHGKPLISVPDDAPEPGSSEIKWPSWMPFGKKGADLSPDEYAQATINALIKMGKSESEATKLVNEALNRK